MILIRVTVTGTQTHLDLLWPQEILVHLVTRQQKILQLLLSLFHQLIITCVYISCLVMISTDCSNYHSS